MTPDKEMDEQALINQIADLFHIGSAVRTPSTILANIRNTIRRANCLDAIEREFFTQMVEDEDEGGLIEECALNWGDEPAQYVERFRAEWMAQQEPLNITVWKDGSYLCQKPGDDVYSRDDPDWLCSIPLVSGYAPGAKPAAQDCVKLQSGQDGVWVHCHAGDHHFSYCLENDWMAKRFCNAYRAILARHGLEPK